MGEVHDASTAEKGSVGAEEEAARKIQRNYRGYRERRQLKGIGLDASARWAEVCGFHDFILAHRLTHCRRYETVSSSISIYFRTYTKLRSEMARRNEAQVALAASRTA
jgi:hypothetical protein